MLFNIRGENIEVTEAIREYIESKVSKIERYFEEEITSQVYVNLKVYNEGQKAEVTIPMSQLTLRAEETQTDLYAAIDLVVDKLERQIRKHKTKVNRKQKEKGSIKYMFSQVEDDVAVEDKEEDYNIGRKKRFSLEMMNVEEAILQMELLGHSFFVFIEGSTGKTSVVYRRKENSYGLIETN